MSSPGTNGTNANNGITITSTFWSKRLEAKLQNLSEQSSNDTHQALAKWIGFNRKHAASFATVFKSAILEQTSQPAKQLVLLSVLHQVFLVDHDTTKYERNAELRLVFGEHVALPVSQYLAASNSNKEVASKMLEYLKEWDSSDDTISAAINNPILISQIKRQLVQATKSSSSSSSSNVVKKEETVSLSSTAVSSPSEQKQQVTPTSIKVKEDEAPLPAIKKEEEEETDKTKATSTPAAAAGATATATATATPTSTTNKQTSTTSTSAAATTTSTTSYDFESKGIPAATVSPNSLLGPCQEIATVQISRDLSNDGAVQLSSLLTNLPQDVREKCAEAAGSENQDKIELPPKQAHDFSLKINEVLIDMDLEEQLKNIQVFRRLIIQQHQARKQLLRLLIQSRCKFGADDAAQAFHQADRATSELIQRKQILADAMELEGFDITNMDTSERGGSTASASDNKDESKKKRKERQFAPLAWYKPISSGNGGGGGVDDGDGTAALPESKRQRTE